MSRHSFPPLSARPSSPEPVAYLQAQVISHRRRLDAESQPIARALLIWGRAEPSRQGLRRLEELVPQVLERASRRVASGHSC